MSISNQADFFLNFQQFGEMKLRARDGADGAAQTVAQQFEGLFLQQMLAAMRSASKIDTGQQSSYMDFYQDMYDKQLAQTIARQDRLGVAKMIMQQMPGSEAEPVETATALKLDIAPLQSRTVAADIAPLQSRTIAADVAGPVLSIASTVTEPSTAVVSKVSDDDFAEVAQIERDSKHWQSPDKFIADILPQVQSAARTLGVSAGLLVAQAALETGWGKHTIKFDDGRSSYNLFGIKAGADWQGRSLNKTSLEFRDGLLQNQVSRFRAYATPAQSLDDYVDFIQTNPRYQQALTQAGNDQAYIREIQNAGYATDPQYANKVLNILEGEVLQRALASLNPGVSNNA